MFKAQLRLALAVVENSADTDAVPTYPGCLPAPEYLRDLRDWVE